MSAKTKDNIKLFIISTLFSGVGLGVFGTMLLTDMLNIEPNTKASNDLTVTMLIIGLFLPLLFVIIKHIREQIKLSKMNESDRINYIAEKKQINKIESNRIIVEQKKKEFDNQISYTQIAGDTSKKSFASGAIKGALGHDAGLILGGVPGAFVGTMAGVNSAKEKKEVTFKVVYNSGDVKVEKVKYGSSRYNELVKYLK